VLEKRSARRPVVTTATSAVRVFARPAGLLTR
jgi:hypothetical protein